MGLPVGKQVYHLKCYSTVADTMYEDKLTLQGKQLERLACTSSLCSWIIDGQQEAAPFLTTHMHRHARMCEGAPMEPICTWEYSCGHALHGVH